MSEAMAAGFWNAFAVLLETDLAASEFNPARWDPLDDLALFPRGGR